MDEMLETGGLWDRGLKELDLVVMLVVLELVNDVGLEVRTGRLLDEWLEELSDLVRLEVVKVLRTGGLLDVGLFGSELELLNNNLITLGVTTLDVLSRIGRFDVQLLGLMNELEIVNNLVTLRVVT